MKTFFYKYSFIIFILFTIAALVGFWPNYYKEISAPQNDGIHLHGFGMSLWALLLITQALLIRFKKYKIHKYTGWFSYVLVPYILISSIYLLHTLVGGAERLPNGALIFMALVINSLFVFALTYSLAIYFRKKPLRHAKLMVATIFPMITPITDRLISRHYPELLQYAMMVDGRNNIQSLGFYLVDIVILILFIFDWFTPKRSYLFLFILAINLAFQFSVFNFYKYDWWGNFSLWFCSLSIS